MTVGYLRCWMQFVWRRRRISPSGQPNIKWLNTECTLHAIYDTMPYEKTRTTPKVISMSWTRDQPLKWNILLYQRPKWNILLYIKKKYSFVYNTAQKTQLIHRYIVVDTRIRLHSIRTLSACDDKIQNFQKRLISTEGFKH